MDKENKQYRSDNTNTGLRKKGPAGKTLRFLLSMFLLAAILFAGLLEYLTPESGGSYWATHIKNCDIYVSDLKNDAFTVPMPLW